MRVKYRPVSRMEQNLDRQDLGVVEPVLQDKASGKDADRTELIEMMNYQHNGGETFFTALISLRETYKIYEATSPN